MRTQLVRDSPVIRNPTSEIRLLLYSTRMLHPRPAWFAIGAVLSASVASSQPISQQASAILNKNCANCHGASQQMSGYDLRIRESALKGGLRGVAIVPGNADESPLVRRLTGAVQPAMPLGSKLADSDIATIRQWINEGAHWTDPDAAAPPAVRTGRRTI